MLVEEIKKNVTFELLSAYVQNVQRCVSIDELIAPTKNMFQQVAAMVLPKVRVEYVSLEMPQDKLDQEESKNQLTSEQKLVAFIRKLQRQIKIQTEETEQAINKLTQQRDVQLQFLKESGQLKDVESMYKTLVDGLNVKILSLEKQTKKVKLTETDLVRKIEKIFEEATALMTQAESIKEGKLVLRLTDPYLPITNVQDRVFPAQDALKYENQLVAILDAGADQPCFNFVLSDGNASQFKNDMPLTEMRLQPAGVAVKKIVVWYHDQTAQIYAIQLFAKDGTKLLQTGVNTGVCKSQETVLEDDERIIGFKGRTINLIYANYYDFQFVIGRMV